MKLIYNKPGYGDKTNDCCGQVSTKPPKGELTPIIGACPEDNVYHSKSKQYRRHMRCNQPRCCVCMSTWASTRGEDIAAHLWGKMRAYEAIGQDLGYPKHVPVSFPKKISKRLSKTHGGRKKLDKMNVDFLAKAGITDFIPIYHNDRGTKFGKSEYRKYYVDKVKGNTPKWKILAFHDWLLTLGHSVERLNQLGYTYISPHYHNFCFGWLKNPKELTNKKVVGVYKNKGERKTLGQLAASLTYALKHAGIAEPGKSPSQPEYYTTRPHMFPIIGRPRGLLSSRRVKLIDSHKIEEPVVCRVKNCARRYHKYPPLLSGEPDRTKDLGVYMRISTEYLYKVLPIKLKIKKIKIKPTTQNNLSGDSVTKFIKSEADTKSEQIPA
ncbi:MAG: hypothetical protein KAJ51_17915 [Thermoplasmata archaeon]|nr:hypothetical protein [Thermoplasmata archaeon]